MGGKWQGRRDGRVVRWQVEKGGRVVKWQGGRFLVVFKGGGRRVTPRFHLLFLMLIKRKIE